MSYGFIMGISVASTMLGVFLKVNDVARVAAEGPLSLYELSVCNPDSGPLRLLILYIVRRMGNYSLILHFLWPITLDIAVGTLYQHTSKSFQREMARLLNRYLKDPDKRPYKQKTLSLIIACFISPGISVLVYIQRRITIIELFLLIAYFYLLQSQYTPYTALMSTALIMINPDYCPIAIFTLVYCLSWTLFVPRSFSRRYERYVFKVLGRILYIVTLQIVFLGMVIIPFATIYDKSTELSIFITNRLQSMFFTKPNPLIPSNVYGSRAIPLPSFWDIVDSLRFIMPEKLNDLADYVIDNNFWIWTAVTVVIFVGINFSVMCTCIRRNVTMDSVYPVLSCFSILMSFAVFVPERSFTIIVPMLTGVYCILLDIISTTSQMATQKGLEHAVATERTHLGLYPVAIQRGAGAMRLNRVTGRCRCIGTNTQLRDVISIIPTSLSSISNTPFACLESENSRLCDSNSSDCDHNCCYNCDSNSIHRIHHRLLRNYNSLRYKSIPQAVLENRNRMLAHPFNNLFIANELNLDNNVYRVLSARDRRKRANQALKQKKESNNSPSLGYIGYDGGDAMLEDSEMLPRCFPVVNLSYFHKSAKNRMDAAGRHVLEFAEEYMNSLMHLLPLILQMLFSFNNMYASIQNTGVIRIYSQLFNVASFLSLRRAFKEHDRTLVWSLPFLLIDILGAERILLNRCVKAILALFMIMCSTALLVFVSFKYLMI